MKTSIALPPFHIDKITSFTVEADHELTEALRRYQTYYREAYGEVVAEGDLLREMGRSFMAQDKGFQGFGKKKRHAGKKKSFTTNITPRSDEKLGFDLPT